MIAWRIEVPPSDRMPRWYGVAYDDFMRDVRVAMPLPLNLIVGGSRALVAWLRFPPWFRYERRIEHIRRAAYQDGLDEGRRCRWFDEATRR